MGKAFLSDIEDIIRASATLFPQHVCRRSLAVVVSPIDSICSEDAWVTEITEEGGLILEDEAIVLEKAKVGDLHLEYLALTITKQG